MTASTEIPTAEALAERFVAILRDWMDADEWAEMCERNAAETQPGICHSHDFCDADMAMWEAWNELSPHTLEVQEENHTALWKQAWDIAAAGPLKAAR